jgi:histidinol-phosphate phosphatase family protein
VSAEGPARVVFFDKDGTLLADVPWNVDPVRMRLAPGAAAGLPLLAAQGYRVAVVSNQPGVARGLFPEGALILVERRLRALLGQLGVALEGFYYCPHDPGGTVAAYRRDCECRKPAPGLLYRAACDMGITPDRAWFVGDILDDVEAGCAAGCRTVLIDNGNETEWRLSPVRLPHHVASDLEEAARAILAHDLARDAFGCGLRNARRAARPEHAAATGRHA